MPSTEDLAQLKELEKTLKSVLKPETAHPSLNQQALTPGRIVHYGRPDGSCRAAIIIRVWSQQTVNLAVFSDMCDDGYSDEHLLVGRTSVVYGPVDGQWHWPNECPHLKELGDGG